MENLKLQKFNLNDFAFKSVLQSFKQINEQHTHTYESTHAASLICLNL